MKKEEKQILKTLINKLVKTSEERKTADLAQLRRPYYFKGRFESLKPQAKREKIRQYYKAEQESIKAEILDLLEAEELKDFAALVEWSNSRTWGKNPHAKVIINNRYVGWGSASGCGYDKRSAAICYGCNDNEQIKKIILGAVLKAHLKSGKPFPYGIYTSDRIYLHFDGCGVETLRSILEYCGVNSWLWHETPNADSITAHK